MRENLSFAEILEGKMANEAYPEDQFQMENQPFSEGMSLSSRRDFDYIDYQLVSEMKDFQREIQGQRLKKLYPRPVFTAKPRPAHSLSEVQKMSFLRLQKWSPALSEGFTKKELKAAFRQAALRTHPDQGGTALLFKQCQDDFRNLSILVA